MNDYETTNKGYRMARNFHEESKFFTMISIGGKMEIAATTPGIGELINVLRKLDIPMLKCMEDTLIEDLVALQSRNGLTLRTANGQDVFVVKADNVEQVGRKIARMLINI
jgi:hypothetical protein